MKRLAALLALTGAFAVAACDEPRSSDEDSLADKAAEQPLAPTAEDAGVPAEAVTPTPPPPTDATTIRPRSGRRKNRSSRKAKPSSIEPWRSRIGGHDDGGGAPS
jgi:hypothetical protein